MSSIQIHAFQGWREQHLAPDVPQNPISFSTPPIPRSPPWKWNLYLMRFEREKQKSFTNSLLALLCVVFLFLLPVFSLCSLSFASITRLLISICSRMRTLLHLSPVSWLVFLPPFLLLLLSFYFLFFCCIWLGMFELLCNMFLKQNMNVSLPSPSVLMRELLMPGPMHK